MKRVFELFVTAVITLGASNLASFGAEPVRLRAAWVVPVTNLPTLFLQKPDLLKFNGKSYTYEPTNYAGTPLMVTALATGELEIGLLAYQSIHLAAINAGMDDIKIIAEELRDGVPGYFTNRYMVRADSGIAKISDLRGKVLATNALGSGADIGMRAGLRKAGLDDRKDVTILESAFPTMKALLMEKKADLVTSVLPFSEDPQLNERAKILYTEGDALGPNSLGLWVVRGELIRKHRAVLVDLLEDYLRVLRFYADPANHQEVTEIAAKLTKRPAAAFSWAFTKRDYYRDPNGRVDLQSLQNNINTVRDFGLINASFDVSKYVDMSLLDEAQKRLK